MLRIKKRLLEGYKKKLLKFIFKISTKKGRKLGNRALIPVPPPPLTPQIISNSSVVLEVFIHKRIKFVKRFKNIFLTIKFKFF